MNDDHNVTVILSTAGVTMLRNLLAAQTCEVGSPDFREVALVASETLRALDASLTD